MVDYQKDVKKDKFLHKILVIEQSTMGLLYYFCQVNRLQVPVEVNHALSNFWVACNRHHRNVPEH